MRHPLIATAIVTLVLAPSLAHAQQTCEERRNNRVAGTVVGGVLGALAGSAVAGKGDRNTGAVIGGLGGAVVGNQVSKGGDCRRAYGYYDNDNVWHSNAIDRTAAQGYYDRTGAWVDGQPPVGGWDRDGRWAASAGTYGTAASYETRGDWRDAPSDPRARSEWLERRIVRSRDNGSLSRRETQQAMATLDSIRRDERAYWRDGRLSERESNALMARLDDLNSQIRWDRRD